MNKSKEYQYIPDFVVTPGEVLEECLDSIGMTQAELAARTGLAKKTINEIIKGKSPISPETSLKFERTLGRPAHFWNNLERQYQEDQARLAEHSRLKANLDWLKKIPVASMTRLGWIKKYTDKSMQLEAVLRFFGIAHPDQWESVFDEYQIAYRKTPKKQESKEALSVWLRQGEILAQQISCATFEKAQFSEKLIEIRKLTCEKPDSFVPKLIEVCASAGVAVVFVPELPGVGVYGATRWLADKPLIQLSLRYKSNDHLWFTFFHEAAHIIKHGRKEVFLEGNTTDCEKEEEANKFARDKLIPPQSLQNFIKKGRLLLPSISRFADEIGIAPGIVVGRLQHDNFLPRHVGNKLKIFYKWSHDEKN